MKILILENQIYVLRENLIAKRDVHSMCKANFWRFLPSNDEDVMEDQIYVLPEKLITKPYSLSMLKFLKIISDDDVMEDQIYVLPERVWTMKEFLAWMPYEYSNFLIPISPSSGGSGYPIPGMPEPDRNFFAIPEPDQNRPS